MAAASKKRITKFGCELEVCWDFAPPGCLADDVAFFDDISTLPFHEKFSAFYKSILRRPGPAFEAIKDTYRYIAYEDDAGTFFLYDLTKPATALPEEMTMSVIHKKKLEDIWNYKIPRFVDDFTIKCGDTPAFAREGTPVKSEQSIRVECITPVLEIEGEITESKVEDALKPLLRFFGLGRDECFFSNSSAGFHVNVSLWNKGADTAIDLGASVFRDKFLRNYGTFENRRYSKVRTRLGPGKTESDWAKRLAGRYRDLLAAENGPKKNAELEHYQALMEKTWAVKVKEGSIFEFRLFQSETDIDKLCDYTFSGLHLLNMIYDDALKRKLTGGSRKRSRTHAARLRLRNSATRRGK